MGRRALRKISPELDLSHHFRKPEDLPRPWEPEKLFGRRAPLELEIGSGKGLFLRTAAAAQPDRDFLGIEIAYRYAQFAAAELARCGLRNAIVVAGDAFAMFEEMVPDRSLAAIHIYFPDPWWKRRHKKRRVIQQSFVSHLERTLEPGGTLHFWTDVEEYFRAATQILSRETKLEGPFDVPESPAEGDLDYRTHFERRTRLHGEPVYRAQFRKPE